MQLSRRIWFIIFAVALIAVTALQLALSLPKANGLWQEQSGTLTFTVAQQTPVEVTGFVAATHHLPASPQVLMPEPDMLDYLPDYFDLLHTVGLLSSALQNNQLAIVTPDAILPLSPSERQLTELPALFWLQWVCGLLALFICFTIWALRPVDLVIRLFVLSGMGYASSVLAAAIYSTRELFIGAELWRTLSFINHAGAFLYAAALSSLLWVYPLRLKGWRWALGLLFAASALTLIANAWQLIDYFSILSYSWILVVFTGGVIGTVWQWRLTRHKPKERAVLRWLQVSVLVGTIFYTAFGIIPFTLNQNIAASQGVLLATFLLLYLGVAMGVLRYRLFDLERWSFNLWSWGISGLLVVALEFAFIGLLSWSNVLSIAVSAAVVGWLYFPVRQWVWYKLMANRSSLQQDWIKTALPQLVSSSLNELPHAFSGVVKQVFQPLHQRFAPLVCPEVCIKQQGEMLVVPLGQQQLELLHAASGRRLFNQDDIRTANYLLQLKRLIAQALTAREDGMKAERERIQQDIHDDLGAKLMGLLHQVPEAQQSLVRDSIRDMRQTLRSLDNKSEPLAQLLGRIKQETHERCNSNHVELHWLTSGKQQHITLTGKQVSHLERILREAVTNALKQPGAKQIQIDIQTTSTTLTTRLTNDGCQSSQPTPRRGLPIMQRRAIELGGQLHWHAQPPLWTLTLQVPLKPN